MNPPVQNVHPLVHPASVQDFLDSTVDVDPRIGPPPRVLDIAEEVHSAGVLPGEVVLVRAPNGVALLSGVLGALMAGAVPALVPPSTPTRRFDELSVHLAARACMSPGSRGRPGPRWVPATKGIWLSASSAGPRFTPGDVVVLTSGTSGVHSGCLHGVDALIRNAERHAASIGLRASDRILVVLPLAFSYAFVAQALAAFVTGARLVISGPPFSIGAFHHAVETQKVTSTSLTPGPVRSLMAAEWRPPRSLRQVTVGGAALEDASTGRLVAHGLETYLTYGLTEAGPRVSTLAAHAEPAAAWSSVGRPIAGVEVRLRDVGADHVGELLVTSDTVLKRRVGVPEGKAADCVVGPQTIATGDEFSIRDGYLYFRHRSSDILVRRDHKVSLASVRRLALSIPGVHHVRSVAQRVASGDVEYDLVVYVDDARLAEPDMVRQELYSRLLRTEHPRRLVLMPEGEAGYK